MHTTEKETKTLQEMASRAGDSKKGTPQKTVKFEDADVPLSINDFFSCFNLEFDLSKVKSPSAGSGDSRIKLNLKSESISNLGT